MTWDELVEAVTAAHPELKPGSMFGMPCLKRPDGKVVAGHWKDGGITVKLTDEAAREEALALEGVDLFDPAAQPPVRESGPVEGARGNREVPPTRSRRMREWVLVPSTQSARWRDLVERAI
jgi:hypothetical protein